MYKISFYEKSCLMDSCDYEIYEAIEKKIKPYFKFDVMSSDNHKVDFKIYLRKRTKDFTFNLKVAKKIELHCGHNGYLFTSKNRNIVFIPDMQVSYVVTKCNGNIKIAYYYKTYNENIQIDVIRVLRGLLIGMSFNQRNVMFHAAAVSNEDESYLFIGNKGSGKTSFMVSFLKEIHGSSFISNDKVLLSLIDDQETVRVYGLPYVISVDKKMSHRCIEYLKDKEHGFYDNKICIWPREYFKRSKNKIRIEADLKAIVIVKIDLKDDKVRILECKDCLSKKNAIQNNLIIDDDSVFPYWLLKILDIKIEMPDVLFKSLMQKRMYVLKGNPWAKDVKFAF